MKIALVHDYLNEAGGAERVLRVLSEMYPKAPIYVAFAKQGTAKKMLDERGKRIVESSWGWLLKIGRMYSYLRCCLPWVWKRVDLTAYDLVITSCSGYIARGFRVKPGARVVAYCHTPPRWLYGYDTPTGANRQWWGKAFMWVVGPFVRYFDYQSAQRVNTWIANSREVAKRIEKFYRQKAEVVYPPIEMPEVRRETVAKRGDYYLVVARMVGGKGIREAIAGARKAGVVLKIVGETVGAGIRKEELESRNVEYLGRVEDKELAKLYAGARGLVALSRDEDFGMTVVEAMAMGTPVLAFNGGGYKETVVVGKTGILIEGTDAKTVAEGIRRMEQIKWEREKIGQWAKKFNRARFEKEIRGVVGA